MTSEQRRVLFVGAFPPPTTTVFGGNISDCRALLDSSFGAVLDLVLLDSTQHSVPPPPLLRRALLAVQRMGTFVRLFHRRRPHVVILFAASGMSFVEKATLALYARVLGVPALLSIRSGHFIDHCKRSRTFRALARLLLKAPAYLVCQGNAWRHFFHSTLGIDPARCPIIENWVASQELLAIGDGRTADPGHTNILFLGWLERFKGIYELLEAVRLLAVTRPELPFTVRIAGEGTESSAARAWVEQHALGKRILFLGWVRGEQKLVALRQADILALPSYTEGLPNAMIEAMAAGVVPVVTPVGSIPDVVKHKLNGIIVPPRSAEHLAIALAKLIEDSRGLTKLAHAAHDTAEHRFGTEQAARAWIGLVDDAATKPRERALF